MATSPIVGSTLSMKTSVSLPDEVFQRAERQARQTKKFGSQLSTEALVEYLARHAPEEVTEAMNQAVDRLPARIDPFVSAAGCRILNRTEW